MKQDVIIVGGGVIGLATAERLLTTGASVTLIERNQTGQESSWAAGGILSSLYPWNDSDEINHLTQYSASLFPEWTTTLHQSTGINCEYETNGMLVLPPFDEYQVQQWCTRQKIKIEPNISIDFNWHQGISNHSLFLPQISQVRSPRLLQALHQRVALLGGCIIEYCTAHHFIVKNNYVESLATSNGPFTASQYLVAAGAWSTALLNQYALNLNIKPIQGQILLYRFDKPPVNKIILQNGRYIIPRKDGSLLIGSTLEDVGFNKKTTQSAYIELLDWAKTLLPQLHGKTILKQWAGLRPASSLEIPVIGKHPTLQNLYVNSGHYRYGITMAPASAEIILNDMAGSPQPFDVTPYQKRWEAN